MIIIIDTIICREKAADKMRETSAAGCKAIQCLTEGCHTEALGGARYTDRREGWGHSFSRWHPQPRR